MFKTISINLNIEYKHRCHKLHYMTYWTSPNTLLCFRSNLDKMILWDNQLDN